MSRSNRSTCAAVRLKRSIKRSRSRWSSGGPSDTNRARLHVRGRPHLLRPPAARIAANRSRGVTVGRQVQVPPPELHADSRSGSDPFRPMTHAACARVNGLRFGDV